MTQKGGIIIIEGSQFYRKWFFTEGTVKVENDLDFILSDIIGESLLVAVGVESVVVRVLSFHMKSGNEMTSGVLVKVPSDGSCEKIGLLLVPVAEMIHGMWGGNQDGAGASQNLEGLARMSAIVVLRKRRFQLIYLRQ